MTIYLSDKKQFNPNHSYSKKMTYTTTLFGFSYADYLELCKNPYISSTKVIWIEENVL